MKKTSIKVTERLAELEEAISEVTGIPKTILIKRAVEQWNKNGRKFDPDVLVTSHKDPRFINKPVKQSISMTEELYEELKKISKEIGVGVTFILLQAIMDYCIAMSSVLPQEKLDEIMEK